MRRSLWRLGAPRRLLLSGSLLTAVLVGSPAFSHQFSAPTDVIYAAGALVSVQPDTATVEAGSTVLVAIALDAPEGSIGAWTVDVAYDPAVVRPLACVSIVDAAAALCSINPGDGAAIVRAIGAAASGIGSTSLARITFEAVGVPGATSALTITVSTMANTEGDDLGADAVNGSVTIAG